MGGKFFRKVALLTGKLFRHSINIEEKGYSREHSFEKSLTFVLLVRIT